MAVLVGGSESGSGVVSGVVQRVVQGVVSAVVWRGSGTVNGFGGGSERFRDRNWFQGWFREVPGP